LASYCVPLVASVKQAVPACGHFANAAEEIVPTLLEVLKSNDKTAIIFPVAGLPGHPEAVVDAVLASDWDALLKEIGAYDEADACPTCGVLRPTLARIVIPAVNVSAPQAPPPHSPLLVPPRLAATPFSGAVAPSAVVALPAARDDITLTSPSNPATLRDFDSQRQYQNTVPSSTMASPATRETAPTHDTSFMQAERWPSAAEWLERMRLHRTKAINDIFHWQNLAKLRNAKLYRLMDAVKKLFPAGTLIGFGPSNSDFTSLRGV
jgi:hypothetical protein